MGALKTKKVNSMLYFKFDKYNIRCALIERHKSWSYLETVKEIKGL